MYAVWSFVSTREIYTIGIHIALGAQRSDVVKMVLKQAIRWSLVGIVFGVAGAFLLTRVLQSVLFNVGMLDPWTYLGVVALLTVVSLVAGYLPARRATQIDPLICLKQT